MFGDLWDLIAQQPQKRQPIPNNPMSFIFFSLWYLVEVFLTYYNKVTPVGHVLYVCTYRKLLQ